MGREGEQATRFGETGACRVFLREHEHEIVACWERLVRTWPGARQLDRQRLPERGPELLAAIGEVADGLPGEIADASAGEVTHAHAIERLGEDYDLTEIVIELGMLRSCITQCFEAEGPPVPVPEARALEQVVDRIVADAIEHRARARERTMDALDRIANAALESRDLEDLLERLLVVLVRAATTIHNATILVREGDRLYVRASVGLEEEVAQQVSVGMDEGFVGVIATSRQPLELPNAATDPLIERPAIRNAGVRGLYGIPLLADDKVVAVIHVGSLTASELAIDDKRLFRAVASRAAAMICEHLLRETSERASRQLRDREQELRALADNIPQLAWMADREGKIYWYNQRWLDYTGTTLEEMRARGAAAFIHRDHRAHVCATFEESIASGKPWEETVPLRASNRRDRWFLSRAIPIRDEHGAVVRWFGTNTDITEQRFLDEATKLLNSSLDYYETLHEIASLAVPDLADWCVVDLADDHGAIQRLVIAHQDPAKIEYGREWDRKFPTDWSAVEGVPQVIRTGDPLLMAEVTDDVLAGMSRDDAHLEALRALGFRSAIIAPLIARGRTLGAITLLTAESDRRYAPEDLALVSELGHRAGMAVDNARLYKESQQSLCEREGALRLREEVLAVVSHDLRNPLSVIGMSAGALREEYPALRTSKRLELIERSADRMEHMIADLLEMATIQAEGLKLNHTQEEAERIIAGVVDVNQPSAAASGVELVSQYELAGVRLLCDRDRIERVFGNLIGNAIKYCHRGDVILVHGGVVDGHVQFSVADSGPGIPPDDMKHLFEPYWTARRPGAKPGTGLGLYICKGIIEAHGGQLWVASVVGQGTEFFFTLPLAPEAHAGPSEPEARLHT